ncbi:MAG: hypothetical protein GXP42_02890, partial [Chloroflexi bacterium]|nr:hypothetical protein [Chloroflexota bacterium]
MTTLRTSPRRLSIALTWLLALMIAVGGFASVYADNTQTIAIHDIQGAAHLSPMEGMDVTGVHGIVTAVTSRTFFMQTPDDEVDDDPATSEGILVYAGRNHGIEVGDEVLVDGTVSEYYPGGYRTGNLSTTQLTDVTVTVVSKGNPLPAPTIIGKDGRMPPNMVIDNNSNGDANTKDPFDPENEGIDFYESLEGMLVQVNDAVAVGPTSKYGEIPVVADNGANAGAFTARGGLYLRPADPQTNGYIRGGDFNPERIHIDDAIIRNEPKVNVGDKFPGAIVGVMGYSFGNFKLLNTAPLPDPVSAGLEPEVAAPSSETELSVATFNVENLNPNVSPSKLQGLAKTIVENLGAPDIIGLQEVQDNSGPEDDGVVDAGRTYLALINAIVEAGGPLYEYRDIPPLDKEDGGYPGANIRVGFLFRPDRVTFVDRPGGDAVTGTQVVPGPVGPELTLNPGRVDPTNPAWAEDPETGFEGTRKPLAGEFWFNGRKVFVIVNHLKSKRGDGALFGRVQPPELVTEIQRAAQAQVVNDFVDSILAIDPNANIIVLGDMNDFEFTPPLKTLKGNELHNLIEMLPANDRYTFLYEGNSQVLDHILVSDNLMKNHLTSVDIVHVNAEFAAAYRASDHDPVLATFDFSYPPYELPEEPTRFRGYVRMGDPDNPGKGIAGVKVHVYGRNDGEPRPGALIQTRITDGSGFYNLFILPDPKYTYDFYTVVAETPDGLIGTGIVSEDGYVLDVDPATIEHFQPSSPYNVIHLNDIYYDYPPELACELTLLHNNDGESQLINAGSGLEDFGGIARFAALAKKLKDEAVNGPARLQAGTARDWLMVTSGDNFLAGPEWNASLDKGVPYYDAIALDYIGYDAFALGNHDFDFGPDVTANFINSFDGVGETFLSANLDFSNEPALQALVDEGRLAASKVVERCGQTVGIIALTTPELPYISSPRGVQVDPNVLGAVEREIAAVQRQGASIIVLISHLQSVEEDMALVEQLADVDIVIAGGGNEVLADPGDLLVPGDEEHIYGPYPLYATDRTGKQVPMVTTAGDYRYIGRLVAGFDADGNLAMIDDEASHMVRVAGGDNPDAVEPDPFVQENVVDPVIAYLDNLANNIIGQSEVPLDATRPNIRIMETNEGDLMADALFWQATQLAESFGVPAPDIALQNGGGIRNNSVIPPGPISELTTFEIAPFPNFVVVNPNVTAEELKDILENAYSKIESVSGRFAHVSGMRVVVDTSKQPLQWADDGTIAVPGERVREVVLADGTVVVQDGVVQDIGRELSVATIDFLARGGDQYPHLADFTRLGVTYQQALSNYIQEGLGGVISAAQYPEGGSGRILIDASPTYTLTVLHNNDGESQIIDAGSGLEDFGGLARFATVMKTLRDAADGGVLTVTSGDNFLAGPEWNASLDKGVPYYDSIALGYIGYDSFTLGNHDFDFGPDVLANFIEGFFVGAEAAQNGSGPVFLSANLDFSGEPRLQALADEGKLAKSIVVEKAGQRIGVVGLTTPDLPFISSPRNVVVDPDVVGAVQSEVDKLLADGVQIIVLVSHLQSVAEDMMLVQELAGVDIVVAGGGNEVLANPGDLLVPGDEENIYGPYPMWTMSKSGALVPIVTTAGDYRYVGRLVASFDDRGVLIDVDDAASHMVRVAGGDNPDAVEPDPFVQQNAVDPVIAYVENLANNVIGQSEVPLDATRPNIRIMETNEGDLMADALFWQATQLADSFGVPAPDVALQNGGGIRNNSVIPPGPITELTTFEIAPFPNFVVINPNVTAEELKDILENAYSKIESVSGRFAHISGMTVVVDTSKQPLQWADDGTIAVPGERVREVVLADGTVVVQDGVVQPLDRSLSVATIDFLARGGDQYP